jgi:predicted transcriptional regulator of viral defense system
MDWVSAIRDEAQSSSVLRADDLARKYKIVPGAVAQALSRLEEKGLVEHISRRIYFNRLASEGSSRELVNILRIRAYISLDSALHEYGISTQSPRVLTCVTTDRPKEFKRHTIFIVYRKISEQLYWGFVKKQTRYGSYQIAEPEKALLDWIYLNLQEGLAPALDELDFARLSRRKLVQYAQQFPSTVYKHLLPTLATETFAA